MKPHVFHIGDEVRFLNEVGGGIVTKVLSSKQVFVQVDGLDIPMDSSELVLIKEGLVIPPVVAVKPADISSTTMSKQVLLTKAAPMAKKKNHFIKKHLVDGKNAEVDMHIWQLIDDFSRMTNGEMVNCQLDYLVKCMNSAMEMRLSSVVFIHGVGKGTLRAEVRKILEGYVGVEVRDASMRKYGVGATEARIFYP